MKKKLILLVALGMISATSVSAKEYTSAEKDSARIMCRNKGEAAHEMALARDSGIPRAKLMELVDNNAQEANVMREMIRVVYDHDESPSTVREAFRKSCMKQFFK